jgi:hypothetical protein
MITRTLGLAILLVAAAPLLPLAASAHDPGAAPRYHSQAAAVAESYVTTLNSSLATHNLRGLAALFAPHAIVTERVTRGPDGITPHSGATTVRGRASIVRFYRQLGAELSGRPWMVGTTNQISPTTIEIYAQTRSSSFPVAYSVQRLTERNGLITQVDWTLNYVP